jgi:Na+:H+ antiporter, NhaA family
MFYMKMKINQRLLNPIKELAESGKLSGILLLIATSISLCLSNIPHTKVYSSFWEHQIGFPFFVTSINHWINDGLMVIFFLLVTLEIKREILKGELSSIHRSLLPIFAALGGMVFPALIYFSFNTQTGDLKGWAIPTATDIAFSLGILSLLGRKVPFGLKVFLTALAIIDDLGAIFIIVIFYSTELHFDMLLSAALILSVLIALNRFKVSKLSFFILLGLPLWYCIFKSGVHATIAGVLLAFTIPLSKIETLEHYLYRPVNYLILPLFALANTAIAISFASLHVIVFSSLGLGIVLGLLLGKPLGIFLLSFIAVKVKMTQLPKSVTWGHLIGIGFAAGIGFTMSLFIANLSFDNVTTLNVSKLSVLLGSILSAIIGLIVLKKTTTPPQ